MRLKPTKKGAILMAFLALVIGCIIGSLPGAQAQYAQAEQDRHVLYFNANDDIAVSLTENEFWINNKKGLKFEYADFESGKGLVNEKEPTIANEKADCYMRACVRVVDDLGRPMEPTSGMLSVIMNNLWYDTTGTNIPVVDAIGTGSYSKAQLEKLESAGAINHYCNTAAFDGPVWNDNMKAFTFNYKTKFTKGSTTKLFNRVIYPTDMTMTEWDQIQDEYYIVVWAQAIQAEGFTDASSALENLSDAYVPTTLPQVN